MSRSQGSGATQKCIVEREHANVLKLRESSPLLDLSGTHHFWICPEHADDVVRFGLVTVPPTKTCVKIRKNVEDRVKRNFKGIKSRSRGCNANEADCPELAHFGENETQICAKPPTIAGPKRTVGTKGAVKAGGLARNASPRLRTCEGRLARSATKWAVFEYRSTDFNEAHRPRLRACSRLFVPCRMSLAGPVCLN